MNNLSRQPSEGYPAAAKLHADGRLEVILSHCPSAAFVDAFSDWTVTRTEADRTSLVLSSEDQERLAKDAAEPAGLIFQISRCGSTLVSQLLKETGAVVYSEPMSINGVLDPAVECSQGRRTLALRAIGALLSVHAGQPFVIKLRSWNALFAEMVREAFPSVPAVLCTRDPVEVAVSVFRRPPTWLRAYGPDNPFESRVPGAAGATREAYVAKVLGAFHTSVLRCGRVDRVVDYSELPTAAWTEIAPLFGLPTTADTRVRMTDVLAIHAKSEIGDPRSFQEDRSEKQAAATSCLRDCVDRFAVPAWKTALDRPRSLQPC